MALTNFHRFVFVAVFSASLFVLVAGASAVDKPEGYALYRVASASGGLGQPQSPTKIIVDSDGGYIEAKLPYGPNCSEKLIFRWDFSRDIRYLEFEEAFSMDLVAAVEGNCDPRRNPYMKANVQFVSLGKPIRARMTEKDFSASAMYIDGKLDRICTKPVDPPYGITGGASYRLAATTESGPADRLWFGVIIEGFSPSGEAFTWQVAYLFHAVAGGRPTNDTIAYDTPGPDSKPTVGTREDSDGPNPVSETTTQEGETTTQEDDTIIPSEDESRASGRTLLVEERTVSEGQRVVVPVRLLNPGGVANIDFAVSYDPAVAVVEGEVIKGSLLGAARMEANTSEIGRIRLAFAQESPLTRDGIVANLGFRAVGRPGDVTVLGLTVTDIDDINGNELVIQRINGRIEIVGANENLRGDCDYDGELTMADVICALQMAVGLMDVDLNLDVTGDGRVTSGDARQILQMIP
jgi:hypothetical protein